MPELLNVDAITAGYGDAIVLEEVSFSLDQGDSLALLGRNGMGKTTLLSTLMGVTKLHKGSMRFNGADLGGLPAHARAHAGLGWVPQERDIFPSLTVEENLTVVALPGPWNLEKVYQMFPRLAERKRNMGNQLSGGEQQMLAMARALMLNPKVLLLDEPMEGLAPLIVQELFQVIRRMVDSGDMAVILVEQHAHQILPLTRQALVLERGRAAYSGPSQPLIDEPARLDQWLGVKAY
jgi:branched-chain amino acid transport system ATP-binding protein